MVWDDTVVDSLAPSYVDRGATQPGHAAMTAEQTKIRKYAGLPETYTFAPLAFETLGGPGPLTACLLEGVCQRLVRATGDPRAGTFLRQRLSLDIQRGNAVAVTGTMGQWGQGDFLP